MLIEELMNQNITHDTLQNGIFLLMDKPKNWTSFDVIRKLQRHWGYKKIGHAGTLDPLATGLLILATGKFTKRIEEVQAKTKTYIANIKLGASTKSFDAEFDEENITDTSHIKQEIIEQVIQQKFIGRIQQVPPVFSAIKVDGKRAYKSAREGHNIILKPREVEVLSFKILEFLREKKDEKNFIKLKAEIVCGKGTYIRSLANDLGKELQVGGYLTDLRRTKIGEFVLE